MLAIALIIVTLIVIIYIAAIYHNGYWKRYGLGGPTPRAFFGNLKEWSSDFPMVVRLAEWTKKYGKVYGIQEGYYNVMVVSDLDMLQELFVKKFEYFHGRKTSPLTGDVDKEPRIHVFNARGPRWKRLRAIANPVFSVNNLKKILPIMYDSTETMLWHLDKAHSTDKSFNIHRYFHELTLDVIMRIAMGQSESLQFQNEKYGIVSQIFENLGSSFVFTISWMLGPIMAPIFKKAHTYTSKIRNEPVGKLIRMIEKEVKRRKAIRDSQNNKDVEELDFIDLFLNVETNDTQLDSYDGSKTFNKTTAKISRRLTTDEIAAQCFLFLLAGYDTTANSLAITSYYLAMNPLTQQRLRDEIEEICPDGEPTYEQLKMLKYADATMKEALRLYPVAASACSRICAETTTLGNYKVEAGTIVQADVLTIQHDKQIWGENADEFHPERWLENGETISQMSWMPFGAGPRICIGMKLAYLEEKLALVYILRKYNLLKCKETEENISMRGGFVISPKSVMVKLELI